MQCYLCNSSSLRHTRTVSISGHVTWMDDNADVKTLTAFSLEDRKRPTGRPRITWIIQVPQSQITEAVNTAQNRPLRRTLATSGAIHSCGVPEMMMMMTMMRYWELIGRKSAIKGHNAHSNYQMMLLWTIAVWAACHAGCNRDLLKWFALLSNVHGLQTLFKMTFLYIYSQQ